MHLLWLRNDRELPSSSLHEWAQRTTPSRKERMLKYHRWQDRQATLFGDLLLAQLLHLHSQERLSAVNWTEYGQPTLQNEFISVSHSAEIVIAAIGDTMVGVDVEQIQEINVEEFTQFFNPNEIAYIGDSMHRFFECWTKKEAVMKADGRGMSLPPIAIDLTKESIIAEGIPWVTETHHLDKAYACHTATPQQQEFTIEQLELAQLIKTT